MNRYWIVFPLISGLAALVAIGLFAGPFHPLSEHAGHDPCHLRTRVQSSFGPDRLLSFGHAAFYATGAYGLALTSIHLNPHPLLGIFFGVVAASFLALCHWLFLRAPY